MSEKTQQLIIHYLAAAALLAALGIGVWQHWWTPGIFEALIIGALSGLGISRSIIYGASQLTSNPSQIVNPTQPPKGD